MMVGVDAKRLLGCDRLGVGGTGQRRGGCGKSAEEAAAIAAGTRKPHELSFQEAA
jgi:hypothetical protein